MSSLASEVAVTRTARTRNENYAFSCGNYQRSLNSGGSWTNFGPTSIIVDDECSDSAGMPYVDSDLVITKDRYNPPRANGETSSGTLRGKWLNNVPYLWALKTTYVGHSQAKATLTDYVPTAGDASAAAARTNPSRPVVDLPLLLYELREIPSLLRWTGERMLGRKASGAYLAWNFGVAPLIGDVMKLLDFTTHVDRRVAELNRLYGRGLRRRVTLGGGSGSSGSYGPGTVSYDGSILTIAGKITWTSQYSKWATIEWKPDGTLPYTSAEVRAQALRAAIGGTLDLALIWNMLPWSWLIDWCVSIGDYLSANRNIVGASPTRINVMVHNQVVVSYDVTSKPSYVNISNEPGKTTFERKRRKSNMSVGISAKMPFLSLRQLGILTALAIQKVPRSAIRLP